MTSTLRIFVGALGAEVNTFAPLPINEDRFAEVCLKRAGEIAPGDDVPLIAAPLARAYELAEGGGFEVIQGLCAGAQPGGRVTQATYEALRDELIADLQATGPVDIVALGLHGATAADGCEDCEGDLLSRIREIIGSDVVIAGLLDPHCHLTTSMLTASDVLIAYKEYPHTDIFETANRLIDVAVKTACGDINPVTAAYRCQTMQRIHTTREPAASLVRDLRNDIERAPMVDVSIGHGFPWGDVSDMGTTVWAIADGDARQAESVARRYADRVIAMGEDSRTPSLSAEGMMHALRRALDGLVVVADSADNPGGGAPSDGTHLLRALLDQGVDNIAAGFFWDPVAVDLCRAAGEGAEIPLRVGGKVSAMSGDPLDLTIRVGSIIKDMDQSFGDGRWPMGATVAVHSGETSLVLTTRRVQCFDAAVFDRLGVDLTGKRVALVKSSQHFYATFAERAAEVLYVEGAGALGDPARLPFQNVTRPLWPLDQDFHPAPQRIGAGVFYGRDRSGARREKSRGGAADAPG